MWGVVKPKLDPWAWVKTVTVFGWSGQKEVVLHYYNGWYRIAYSPTAPEGDFLPFLDHTRSAGVLEAECWQAMDPNQRDSFYFAYNTLKKRFELYRVPGKYIATGVSTVSFTYYAHHLKKRRNIFEKITEYDYTIPVGDLEPITFVLCNKEYHGLRGITPIHNYQFPTDYSYIYIKQIRSGDIDITDSYDGVWYVIFYPPQPTYLTLELHSKGSHERVRNVSVTITLVKRRVYTWI